MKSKTYLFLLSFIMFNTCFLEAQEMKNTYELKKEFIFETLPTPSCHASTIAETKSGLVAAWFGGKHEKNPDVEIWVSRKAGGPPYSIEPGHFKRREKMDPVCDT